MIRALATRGSSCGDIAHGSRRFCRAAFAIDSTVAGIERVSRNCQSMTQMGQQLDKCRPSRRRVGKSQFRWRIDERGIVRRQIVQRNIFCPDETQLLQIGVGEAPSTPLVCPNSVSKHPRQTLLCIDLGNALALGDRASTPGDGLD